MNKTVMRKREDLIYPDESYKIVGILYDVFNNLGSGHKECFYQKAIAIALTNEKIKFKEQAYTPVTYKNVKIGKYFLDFLIDDKIVLEIKKDSIFRKQNIEQVYSYLKANNLKLGILANFTRTKVDYKRILNIN
ncbi:MAG: hypothetical protein ACD_58C00265G0006 [uncultured bacterium]|nr:MAG: hypothetical protein ACD_58C00265G0006 [uncultured bacterium]